MVRLFPSEITAADVQTVLTDLDRAPVPTVVDESKLELAFSTSDGEIDVKICDGWQSPAVRRALSEAISALPELYARLVEDAQRWESGVGPDDHGLCIVTIEENRISLYFVGVSYNTSWDFEFHRQCDGGWVIDRPTPPVSGIPSEWRSETAVLMARRMNESRNFTAMPILADALEESGCDNLDILSHCRGPGPHVRGCWVVNMLIENE